MSRARSIRRKQSQLRVIAVDATKLLELTQLLYAILNDKECGDANVLVSSATTDIVRVMGNYPIIVCAAALAVAIKTIARRQIDEGALEGVVASELEVTLAIAMLSESMNVIVMKPIGNVNN